MPARREPAAGATLETCLAEAREGRAAPVYLLDGDAFLSLRAARELAEALVPEAQRALNVVEMDAAASPAEVAAEVATGGLFGGSKVVLVQEPAFLVSREDLARSFAAAREMWGQGRQREAARRVLAIAAKAGWTAADLEPGEGADFRALRKAFRKELEIDLEDGDRAFLHELSAWARERDLKAAKDDASALDAALARGFPRGHVLLVAAGKVDGRLPLVKKLAAAGRRVTLGIESEGKPWEEPRLVLGPLLESLLAGTGKRVDRGGAALLAERVGADARTLAQEVTKLVAFVGDRQVVGAADVEAVVSRVAADPFFALGNAVEARDLTGALSVLDRSIADGAHPVMILGSLAAAVRRMLTERERARKAAGEERLRDAREWERVVFPTVPPDEAKGKKPWGFWMKYQAALRFTRGELLEGLAALAEADVAMKSGRDGRIALEGVLFRLLAGNDERNGRRSVA
ncbi:MAG TPA: DNA polymerase III subunit delta [Anaeromyxobacteraceae bacterium]|nr:DNA polymerase III subunit delta [Anaeromyxobacteraceae bacterium]